MTLKSQPIALRKGLLRKRKRFPDCLSISANVASNGFAAGEKEAVIKWNGSCMQYTSGISSRTDDG